MAHPSRHAERQELQHLMRDIPNLPSLPTLRHLASKLREDASPEATLLGLCRSISSAAEDKPPSPRDSPLALQYLSGPPRRPATATTTSQQNSSPLLCLPDELLLAVTQHLDPASAVCAAQNCRHLSGVLDYFHPDLRRVALAWVFERRELGRRFRRFVFEATERLDRDRLAVMARAGPKGMLACAVCMRMHPAESFAPEERDREAGRRCLASQRRLRACHTWTLDLQALRAHRRTLLTSAEPGARISEPHRPRLQERSCIAGHEGPCTLRLNSRDELVATRRIPVRTGKRAVRLCAHAENVFTGAGSASGRCEECGVSWIARVRWEPFAGPERVLEVQWVLGTLGDAWEEGYVRWTGEGVQLGSRVEE